MINPTDSDLNIRLTGRDGNGEFAFQKEDAPGFVSFDVAAGGARTLTARELENGSDAIEGSLGEGAGKWELFLLDQPPVWAMSLLESPTGNLTNLSTLPAYRSRTVPLMLSNADAAQHGFVRIVNNSSAPGFVEILAIEDAGRELGPVTLHLSARQTLHFNSRDLEEGAPHKGISQGIGTGSGNWRLEFSSALWMDISALVRTRDGLLTSMHDDGRRVRQRQPAGQEADAAQASDFGHEAGRLYHLPTFNPASNTRQRSLLRLVNPSDQDVEVAVQGIDDSGRASGNVQLTLAANASRTIDAPALEQGDGKADLALGSPG